MADNTFPMNVSKDDNANALSNPIYVSLSDGANAIMKAEDSAHSSGDYGLMTLAVRNDAGTALAGTDGDYIPLTTDANGNLRVSVSESGLADDSAFTVGTSKVTPAGFLADETTPDSVDEGDIGAARMTLDRKLLVRVVGASDANRLDINANGHAKVDLSSVNGTAHGPTNPVYVYQVDDDGASSTEVHDYLEDNVAGGGSNNHDYTVAGSYFLLKRVEFGSSAGAKLEVKTGPLASLVTKAVAFIPKNVGGSYAVKFEPAIKVPVASTGTVRAVKTNLQGSANSIYTTIEGNDYA